MEASLLGQFRTTVPVQVRFSDTDALGHVNNAVYLSYLELARLEYLKRCLGVTSHERFDVIVARIEIDYRSPVRIGESLTVGTRVTRLGGASFDMDYRIEEAATARLVAQAKSVMVRFDYRENRVKRLDEDFVDKVRSYDGLA